MISQVHAVHGVVVLQILLVPFEGIVEHRGLDRIFVLRLHSEVVNRFDVFAVEELFDGSGLRHHHRVRNRLDVLLRRHPRKWTVRRLSFLFRVGKEALKIVLQLGSERCAVLLDQVSRNEWEVIVTYNALHLHLKE